MQDCQLSVVVPLASLLHLAPIFHIKGAKLYLRQECFLRTFSTDESRRYVLCVLLLCEGAVFVSVRLHARADLTANVMGRTDATKHLSSNGS